MQAGPELRSQNATLISVPPPLSSAGHSRRLFLVFSKTSRIPLVYLAPKRRAKAEAKVGASVEVQPSPRPGASTEDPTSLGPNLSPPSHQLPIEPPSAPALPNGIQDNSDPPRYQSIVSDEEEDGDDYPGEGWRRKARRGDRPKILFITWYHIHTQDSVTEDRDHTPHHTG